MPRGQDSKDSTPGRKLIDPEASRPARRSNCLSDPTRRERAHRPAGLARETPFNWPRLGTVPGAETTEMGMAATTPELGHTRPDPPDT